MIWGAFSFSITQQLQVVQGHHAEAGYVEMLQGACLLGEDPRQCREGWIFQQGSAIIQNVGQTKDFFQENNVILLDHPACSPDFNPIDNVFGWLARDVYENG